MRLFWVVLLLLPSANSQQTEAPEFSCYMHDVAIVWQDMWSVHT